MGDATHHGTGPTNRGRSNGMMESPWDIRNLVDFALLKKHECDLDCWENGSHESFCSPAAFFEWHFRSGFHGTDGERERADRACFLAAVSPRTKRSGTVVRTFPTFIALTRLGSNLPATRGERNRSGKEIIFDEAVDDANFALLRFDRVAP